MNRLVLASIALLLAATAPACKTANDGAAPQEATSVDIDKIIYHFQDASVPPPDHRSVTITATSSSILRIVDSYGDEIERQERALTVEEFEKIVAAYASAKLAPQRPTKATPRCTGGTAESLRASKKGAQVFSGSIDHCGGEDARDFEGDFEAVVAVIKASVAAPE